jgi:hypothetical protein
MMTPDKAPPRRGSESEGNLSAQVLLGEPSPHESVDNLWSQISLRSILWSVFLASGAFVLSCLFIAFLLPPPIDLYTEIRSEKLALAQKWARFATVAAFGSSHVDCGFDPRVFDASFGGQEQPSLSVNLAVSGGGQIEQTVMGEKFLSLVAEEGATQKHHLLLLEINLGVNFPPKFLTHPRAINIYDWRNLQLAMGFADPAIGLIRSAGRAGYALIAAAMNFMNTGMLSSAAFPRDLNPAIVRNQTVSDRRGLSPPPQVGEIDPELLRRESSSADLEATPEITPGYCAEWRRLTSRSSRQNITAMFIVTPKLTDLNSPPRYPATLICDGAAVKVINVSQPDAHPDLYAVELWRDTGHLNERGAAVYTQLLARAVSQAMLKDSPSLLRERADVIH